MNIHNYEVDPFNSDAAAYPFIKTAGMGGGATMPDFFVPISPNYPPTNSYAGSPTRYFLDLPYVIDISDTTARPITVYSVTGAATLTRVLSVPNANEYRVAVNTSNRRTTIEFNVANAGHKIAFQGYIIGSTLTTYTSLESKSHSVKLSSSDAPNNLYNPIIIPTTSDAAVFINHYVNLISSYGGGTVVLSEGTFNCQTVIEMKSNVILSGQGISTVLVRAANTASIINIAAGQTNFKIKDMKLDGKKATYAAGSNKGIVNGSNDRSYFDGVFVYDNISDGFNTCNNLSNCVAIGNGRGYVTCTNITASISTTSTLSGFDGCSIIENCQSTSNTTRGFLNCLYLSGCTASSNTTVGFEGCTNLTICNTASNTSYGYKDCTQAIGCKSTGDSTYGFYNCDYSTSCIVSSLTGATRYGFYQSDFLVNCFSTVGTGSVNYRGFMDCDKLDTCHAVTNNYGFYDCNGILHNTAASSATQSYNNCFADMASLAPITSGAADSAASGWNVG